MKPVFLFLLLLFQNDPPDSGLALYQKGFKAQKIDLVDSAMFYYQQALKASDLNPQDQSGVLINLSIILKNRGQYDQALEHAFDGLSLTSEQTRSRSSALNTIASIYYLIGDHSKALDYYLQTLHIREAINYEKGIAISLNNISNVFIAVEQYDSAITYLNRTLVIRKKLEDDRGIALVHNNLGLAYMQLEEFKASERELLKSLGIKEKLLLKSSLPHTHRLLGNLYLNTNRLSEGKYQLQRALVLARQYQLREVEKQTLAELSRYYALIQDYKNQVMILNQYIVLSDSLLNEEKTKALTEMAVKYESDKKDQEISYLEALDMLQRTEINNQRDLVRIGFSAAFFFLLLGALAIISYRIAIKRKKQIELLHHDMKHRVSNHLQLLISLLKLQKSEVAGTAREVLNTTESRVEAMALIHQKLFSGVNTMKLDIKMYLEELLLLLERSFQNERKLTIQTKIDLILIDVNLVTYLGLIVNELITNAVKHAWHYTEEEAKIEVVLESKSGGTLFLEVRDNGLGLPESQYATSFGSHLITTLSQQLQADVSTFNQEGAVFQFSIPYAHET